jgi:hypothetical protein
MLVEIRSEFDGDGRPMVVSGCVGPAATATSHRR